MNRYATNLDQYGLPADYVDHFRSHDQRHFGCRYCLPEYTSARQFFTPEGNRLINELFDHLGVPEDQRDTLVTGELLQRIIREALLEAQDQSYRR